MFGYEKIINSPDCHCSKLRNTCTWNALPFSSQKQLNDFDNLTTQLVSQAEREVLPQQEIEDTNERLKLKEKQLREIAEAMRSYSPVDELKKKYELEAREAAAEAEKYLRGVMKKMQEELERRKAEQKKREEERKRKMQAQMQ